jgi:2-polyprenyl-3-methyl-5-hydroxy-6-metoxy-1,4-benzoquinol methylase
MDISGRALDYLGRSPQGNHANIVQEEADVFDVLSEKRAYDLIMCSGLIEELGETKQHILIESLKSWVHERGLMIFRYVTEKRLTPESATEVVVNHRELVNRFSNE